MATEMSPLTRKLTGVLKPLGKSEARRAEEAAVAYLRPELVRNGQSRFAVLGAQLDFSRAVLKAPIRRSVEVLVLDYLNRRHLRVVVSQGRISEVRELDWQPAFTREEIAEAKAIADRDPTIRKIVKRRGVFVSPFALGGAASGERRIGLHYLMPRKGEPTELIARAEVDLSEGRLVGASRATGGSHGELR